eukprot:1731243-Rhodomonas_salina.1
MVRQLAVEGAKYMLVGTALRYHPTRPPLSSFALRSTGIFSGLLSGNLYGLSSYPRLCHDWYGHSVQWYHPTRMLCRVRSWHSVQHHPPDAKSSERKKTRNQKQEPHSWYKLYRNCGFLNRISGCTRSARAHAAFATACLWG